MTFVTGYRCTTCDMTYGPDMDTMTCPICGEIGILDVLYDYDEVAKKMDRYRLSKDQDYSIWRYLPLIPVLEKPAQSLRVGWTPLYASTALRDMLGIKGLYIKDEGLNPTASLKDRASLIACVKAQEAGADTICCSSTGNAASSLAGNAAKMGLNSVIFVPERAPLGKVTQLLIYGATVISVAGDYRTTYELSKKAIDQYGFYNRNAAVNPYLVEGKKTVALEIAEQLDFKLTDWVVVSVGDGCTIGGVYKGFYDLKMLGMIEEIPKILGVQAEGCAPIYKAFVSDMPLEPVDENTLADSIAVGIPRNPIKALNAVKHSNGAYVTVSDEAILDAIKTLGQKEGIFGEPAGVASLAGLKTAVEKRIIQSDETVTIIMTGNGLKDVNSGQRVIKKPVPVQPGSDEVDVLLKQRMTP